MAAVEYAHIAHCSVCVPAAAGTHQRAAWSANLKGHLNGRRHSHAVRLSAPTHGMSATNQAQAWGHAPLRVKLARG